VVVLVDAFAVFDFLLVFLLLDHMAQSVCKSNALLFVLLVHVDVEILQLFLVGVAQRDLLVINQIDVFGGVLGESFNCVHLFAVACSHFVHKAFDDAVPPVHLQLQ